MIVMALDTALQTCSVTILRDGAVAANISIGMERGHAEHLAPMAAAALEEARVKIADLDRIGVVVGPGGFTGVRVALSFARGLVIGAKVGLVGVTSLAALAGGVAAKDALVAPIIDARRGQVYAALYGSNAKTLAAPFVATPEQALKKLKDAAGDNAVLTVGSGAALLPSPPAAWSPSGASDQIDSKVVAEIASTASIPDGPVSPLYLRAPDAKPPKPGPMQGVVGA